MRPEFVKSAVALLVCGYLVSNAASASEAHWVGSYSAQGQCFCVGDLETTVSSRIVPTPVGGQSVQQICQRLGTGPGLSSIDGLFNHPVYADAQCGHGPALSNAGEVSEDCAGSLDGKGDESEFCQPIGPKWDLAVAFGKKKHQRQPCLRKKARKSQSLRQR